MNSSRRPDPCPELVNRRYKPQEGDVLAFSGSHWMSRLIQVATFSPYSHVGIVYRCPVNGLLLAESTTMLETPCVVRGMRHSGVQAHCLVERINSGDAVYVLSPWRALTWLQANELTRAVHECLGRPYDWIEAPSSATVLFKRRWIGTESQLFCSELVLRLLQRVGIAPPSSDSFFDSIIDGPVDASDYSPRRLVSSLYRKWQLYQPPRLITEGN